MVSETKQFISSRIITIDADQAGQRIDNFLFNRLKSVPKTRIYKMIRKGEVRINKGRIKPVYRLQSGDKMRLPPLHLAPKAERVNPALNRIKDLEARIIYESKRLLVLNKPAGMAVHGGSGDDYGVIEALRSLRPEAPYLELVHRLDKLTSGCLLIAKKRSTLRFLHEQLRNHTIQKTYHAWVWGDWPDNLYRVEQPLMVKRFPNGDRRSLVSPDGKASLTRFKKLRCHGNFSLVSAQPVTGRMHQIRVHCDWAGHPICGDSKYIQEPDKLKHHRRLYLHAAQIEFDEHPEEARLCLNAESESFNRFS